VALCERTKWVASGRLVDIGNGCQMLKTSTVKRRIAFSLCSQCENIRTARTYSKAYEALLSLIDYLSVLHDFDEVHELGAPITDLRMFKYDFKELMDDFITELAEKVDGCSSGRKNVSIPVIYPKRRETKMSLQVKSKQRDRFYLSKTEKRCPHCHDKLLLNTLYLALKEGAKFREDLYGLIEAADPVDRKLVRHFNNFEYLLDHLEERYEEMLLYFTNFNPEKLTRNPTNSENGNYCYARAIGGEDSVPFI